MFKEQYRKANDEIVANEELLHALLKKAEQPRFQKRVPWIGMVAAAAMIGLCVFSYSYVYQGETQGELTVATEQTQELPESPKTELKQSDVTPEVSSTPVTQAPVVAQTKPVPREDVISDEPVSDIPAVASAVVPRIAEEPPVVEVTPVPEETEEEEEELEESPSPEPTPTQEEELPLIEP